MIRIAYLLALPALIINFTALADERVTAPQALIVRGQNGGAPCDAQAIGNGSVPKVNVTTDVQSLSVNCSANSKDDINTLRANLPQANICWAKLEELEQRNASVVVQTNPIPGNPYHCLIGGITPTEMVKALHFRQ